MRILFWMESHHPVIGGIQTAARQLFPALTALGHEVTVITSHNAVEIPDVSIQDGVSVHRFRFHEAIANNNSQLFTRELRKTTKFLRELAPDVVHVLGFGITGIFYLRARQSYKTPYIMTIRNENSALLRTLGRDSVLGNLLAEASWITTASQLEVRRIIDLMPEVASRISCVYHGLSKPAAPVTPLPTLPRLLCIGRIEAQKNFALAVQAFARIADSFPTARLLFAGDGTERAALEQLVDDLGLTDRVDFLGWVQPEQIPALISRVSAVVLPSRWEGLPLTGIQVAQMARPLIATRVSGTPELVVDGETGLLTPPDDVEALAAAMQSLLSDPARAAQLGQAAYARINTKFTLTGMVDDYTALYARVTAIT